MTADIVKSISIPEGHRVVIIGDLHLQYSTEKNSKVLLDFISRWGKPDLHLLIIGDLFYYYVENKRRIASKFTWLLNALVEARKNWGSITLAHGNRDFYLGSTSLFPSELRVAGDFLVLKFPSNNTLISHGDLFMNKDKSYFRFRRLIRSKTALWLARNLPADIGVFIADRLRFISFRKGKNRVYAPPFFPKILDAARSYECSRVIFGHFHKKLTPQDFPSSQEIKAWCIGAWENGNFPVLVCDDKEVTHSEATTSEQLPS